MCHLPICGDKYRVDVIGVTKDGSKEAGYNLLPLQISRVVRYGSKHEVNVVKEIGLGGCQELGK